MLLGIFSAKGVLPLEFKPAHSVGDCPPSISMRWRKRRRRRAVCSSSSPTTLPRSARWPCHC